LWLTCIVSDPSDPNDPSADAPNRPAAEVRPAGSRIRAAVVPRRRRLWPAMLVACVSCGALGGALWQTLGRRGVRDGGPTPFNVADAFVEGLLRADGLENGDDPTSRTGYRAAYDLLTADAKAKRDFDDFYEEWARRADAAGFFERREWANRGSRAAERLLLQQFLLTSSSHASAEGDGYRLDVRLAPESDAFRVHSYAITPVHGGRSR
jgi:hypothetical protein